MTPPADRSGAAAGGSVSVRRMRTRDLDGVLAIERVVYPRPWTKELFRDELTAADRSYLVATTPSPGSFTRKKDVVVGYGGIQLVAGEAHVVTVAAHPAWRRIGVGAHLVLELLARAQGHRATAVTLEVRDSNHAARRLYASYGFVDVGARPGYYADNREDARILWLHDLPDAEVRASLGREATRRGLPVPSAFTPRRPAS